VARPGDPKVSFERTPECNSPPFGFSNIAFRIFKYRNIEDSGLVKLADRLTCIVGKNQSGKTNLLRGLQKLNPHDPSIKYDVRTDWPRGGRRTKDERQVVCEAHFDLDDGERGEL